MKFNFSTKYSTNSSTSSRSSTITTISNYLTNFIFIAVLISLSHCLDGYSEEEDFSSANDVCEIYEELTLAHLTPCKSNVKEWYYSAGLQKCTRRKKGCELKSQNSFPSYEACDKSCGSSRICKMDLQIGLCRADLTRYYFNITSGDCEEFRYTGCGGNANRFMSEKKCYDYCGSVLEMEKEMCRMPKEVGQCDDDELKYYYEYNTRSCQKFHYSGCAGNRNRFESLRNCLELKRFCVSNEL